MVSALQILGGLVVLLAGGRALVWSGVSLAERLGVSPLMIGLTVVAAGTSSPELVVNLMAALRDVPSLGVGNVVGANIANVLLVLGAAGLVCPIARNPEVLRRDGPVMMLAVLGFAATVWGGEVARWQGVLMIACLAAYVVVVYRLERRSRGVLAERKAEMAEHAPGPVRPMWQLGLVLIAAIAALILGSDLLVDGAIAVARGLGVREAVIGATIVALGTVMPEIAASVSAALHRHTDLAIGNVIGSIVVNTLGVLGLTAIVRPYPIPPDLLRFDLWVMLAACFALMALGRRAGGVGRRISAVMVGAYVVYAASLYGGVPARLGG
jgi:cation:H+ antiporter